MYSLIVTMLLALFTLSNGRPSSAILKSSSSKVEIEQEIISPTTPPKTAPPTTTERPPLFEGLAKHLGFGSSVRSYQPPVFTQPPPPGDAKARKHHYHVQCRMKCVSDYMECMRYVNNVGEEIIVCNQGRDGCIKECKYDLIREQ